MKYEVVTLTEKILVGLNDTTGNTDPEMGVIIGGLWQEFYQSGVYQRVKNKVNTYAIGLYSDYAGDKYQITVGNEVSEASNPDLVTKVIPAGKYAKFQVKGDMNAVALAWGKIWQLTEISELRTYTGDFEEYLTADVINGEIDIYIAIN